MCISLEDPKISESVSSDDACVEERDDRVFFDVRTSNGELVLAYRWGHVLKLVCDEGKPNV